MTLIISDVPWEDFLKIDKLTLLLKIIVISQRIKQKWPDWSWKSVYVSLEKMTKSLKSMRKIRFSFDFFKFEKISNNITCVSAPKFLTKWWKTKMIQSKGQLLTNHDSVDHFSSKCSKFKKVQWCKIAQKRDFSTKFAQI